MTGRSSDDGTDRGGDTDGTGATAGADDADPTDADPTDGDDGNLEGVFGPLDEPRSIEPGDPSPEHALFVLLGVLTGVASTLALVGII